MILGVTSDEADAPLPDRLSEQARAAYRATGLSGADGQDLTVALVSDGTPVTVLLVGLGASSKVDAEAVRRAARRAARRLPDAATVVATALHLMSRVGGESAVVEGFSSGRYRFDRYRSARRPAPVELVLVGGTEEASLDRHDVIERHVTWARDLVNTPAGDLGPDDLGAKALALAGPPALEVTVHDAAWLAEQRCAAILAVGRGSHRPPCLIEARYRGPDRPDRRRRTVALVGKGITFDSGGLALKRPSDQVEMKSDMAGGATVLAAAAALAELAVPGLDLRVLVPAAENMPGGGAVRPGDVVIHRNGVSTEVADPDCEGRLVMADALALCAEESPEWIVDVATLTYDCIAAVGTQITTALGNNAGLVSRLRTAGDAVGEPVWELPLWQPYLPLIESSVADLRNEAKDGSPGAVTAALFLQHFVGDRPWVHLDIGGTAFVDEADDDWAAGGTGVMVRTLVRVLGEWSGDDNREEPS